MEDYGYAQASTDNDYESIGSWSDFGVPAATQRQRVPKRVPKRYTAEAFPGVAITAKLSENEEHRRALIGIFKKFGSSGQLSPASTISAEIFLRALPHDKDLPKVSLDGEGGLTMAWQVPGQARNLITISDWMIYAVSQAGTVNAIYLPDTPFNGLIPENILAVIPE